MTTHVSPALLLPKLQPCLKNRNPRIRAKASMCFSRSVPQLVNQTSLDIITQSCSYLLDLSCHHHDNHLDSSPCHHQHRLSLAMYYHQGIEGIGDYGIEKLVQAAASQLSDQLPESREAARTVLLELQTVHKKTTPVEPEVEEHPEAATWQIFCQSNLSPLSAQAVLRVTNVASVAREGLVTGS